MTAVRIISVQNLGSRLSKELFSTALKIDIRVKLKERGKLDKYVNLKGGIEKNMKETVLPIIIDILTTVLKNHCKSE